MTVLQQLRGKVIRSWLRGFGAGNGDGCGQGNLAAALMSQEEEMGVENVPHKVGLHRERRVRLPLGQRKFVKKEATGSKGCNVASPSASAQKQRGRIDPALLIATAASPGSFAEGEGC